MNQGSTGAHFPLDQGRRQSGQGRSKMRAAAMPTCVTTQPFVRNRSSALIRPSIEREGWKIVPVARKRSVTRLESNSTRASAAPGEKEDIPDFERLPSAKEVISRKSLSTGNWLDA